MEQLELSLFFELNPKDKKALKNVVKDSFLFVKRKNPKPIEGETYEEYHIFIRDETMLEIAHRLTQIATRRDNNRIHYLYGGKNENIRKNS